MRFSESQHLVLVISYRPLLNRPLLRYSLMVFLSGPILIQTPDAGPYYASDEKNNKGRRKKSQ